MSEENWDGDFGKAITVHLNGEGINGRDARGQPVTDDSFIMCFNAHREAIEFRLPPEPFGPTWTPLIDTAAETCPPAKNGDPLTSDAAVKVSARSLIALTTGSAQ